MKTGGLYPPLVGGGVWINHCSHGSVCVYVVRATTQVCGEMENSAPATPKSHNRSSQKVAYVITSRISTYVQNLVTIPQGVSFSHVCEIDLMEHQNVNSASFLGSSNGPQPRPLAIFSQNTSNLLAEPDIRRIDPEQSDMHPTGVPFHCFTVHACPPSSLLGRSTTLRLKFGTVLGHPQDRRTLSVVLGVA